MRLYVCLCVYVKVYDVCSACVSVMSVCREVLVPAAEPSARGSLLPPCCLSSRPRPPSRPCDDDDEAVPIMVQAYRPPRLLQTFTTVLPPLLCPGRSPADMCSPCLCCRDYPPWQLCQSSPWNVVSSIPGGHVPLRSYLLCLWHQLASRSRGLVGARWLPPPPRWFCPPQHRALWAAWSQVGAPPCRGQKLGVVSPSQC